MTGTSVARVRQATCMVGGVIVTNDHYLVFDFHSDFDFNTETRESVKPNLKNRYSEVFEQQIA
jgi:hypothetical protein